MTMRIWRMLMLEYEVIKQRLDAARPYVTTRHPHGLDKSYDQDENDFDSFLLA